MAGAAFAAMAISASQVARPGSLADAGEAAFAAVQVRRHPVNANGAWRTAAYLGNLWRPQPNGTTPAHSEPEDAR